MNPKTVQSISTQVYRQYPEFKGVEPKVRLQAASNPEPLYLLNFQVKVSASNGQMLSRWVRVVADDRGKIRKISTSR